MPTNPVSFPLVSFHQKANSQKGDSEIEAEREREQERPRGVEFSLVSGRAKFQSSVRSISKIVASSFFNKLHLLLNRGKRNGRYASM